jgi:hypothetical protein
VSGETTIHRLARAASPSHRRWRRIVRQSTLDPDAVPEVEHPGPRDFIICGSPRSGTALLSAMLWQPPDVVTVMEPWDALRLLPAELFRSLRAEMMAGSLNRGRLDLESLERDGAVVWHRDRERTHPVTISETTAVGVKFPAFWRYLSRLPSAKFLVCLRDPAEVVGSYAGTNGRLAQGLEYDVPFNAAMNEHLLATTDDVLERQIEMYDYIHEQVLPHLARPNVLPIRYERWFEEPRNVIDEISTFLHVDAARPRPVIRRRSANARDSRLDHYVRSRCRTAHALGYQR